MHIVGVDIGGTKISAAKVEKGKIITKSKVPVSAKEPDKVIIGELYGAIDQVIDNSVTSIGVGVPSVVDPERGIIYDVQNIPSWKEVHLKSLLEEKYSMPVHVNNDVNCFALGEKFFGQGREYKNFVGLAIGTGLGMGVVLNGKLHNGLLCGAGEIGMIPYKDDIMEAYCSGIFFNKKFSKNGKEVADAAMNGEQWAIDAFAEMGYHLGNAIITILHMYAPEAIVIGGSFQQSFHLYEKELMSRVNEFAFDKQLDSTTIIRSQLNEMATLGAAGLCLEYL